MLRSPNTSHPNPTVTRAICALLCLLTFTIGCDDKKDAAAPGASSQGATADAKKTTKTNALQKLSDDESSVELFDRKKIKTREICAKILTPPMIKRAIGIDTTPDQVTSRMKGSCQFEQESTGKGQDPKRINVSIMSVSKKLYSAKSTFAGMTKNQTAAQQKKMMKQTAQLAKDYQDKRAAKGEITQKRADETKEDAKVLSGAFGDAAQGESYDDVKITGADEAKLATQRVKIGRSLITSYSVYLRVRNAIVIIVVEGGPEGDAANKTAMLKLSEDVAKTLSAM